MGFLDARDDLPADGAMFIRRINEVEKIGRDGERELVVGEFRAGVLFRCERGHQTLQLFQRRDAVLELPVPVVPVGIGNVVPEAAPGRMELFEKLESLV